MTITVSTYIGNIYVEVDLADIETEALQDELNKRLGSKNNMVPTLGGEYAHPLHEIYYAMKFRLIDKANDLMRTYICDELGVIL